MSAPQPDDDIARFQKEHLVKWSEYSEFSNTVQADFSLKVSEGDKISIDSHIINKQNDQCKLSLQESHIGQSRKNIYCINNKYAFSLSNSTSTDEWKIDQIQRLPLADANPIARETKQSRFISHPLLYAYMNELKQITSCPNFKITKSTIVEGGFVQFSFDNKHSENETPFVPVQSGTLVLDKNGFWTLRSCELNVSFPGGTTGKVRVDIEFAAPISKFPIPKKITEVHQLKMIKPKIQDVNQLVEKNYSLTNSHIPSYDEFTLSAFKFNEPSWLDGDIGGRTTFPWFISITFIGILILVLAIIIQYQRRKHDAKP